MRTSLEVTTVPDQKDREAIGKVLLAYNEAKAGKSEGGPIVVRLRDGGGDVVGGLWARYYYRWMLVEWLSVPESLRGRGLGRDIMRKAEEAAAGFGCIGVWLDTFEFQALGFYQKLGYSVFGQIEDYPPGSRRYFLQKRLLR